MPAGTWNCAWHMAGTEQTLAIYKIFLYLPLFDQELDESPAQSGWLCVQNLQGEGQRAGGVQTGSSPAPSL